MLPVTSPITSGITSPITFQSDGDDSSFFAPFDDAGSGAVLTRLLRGIGSPTFTRATTAMTVNSAGLLVPVGTGIARSYYDPTSLAYLGYLAEGVRTNLCLQSEDFSNASWAKTDVTVTANQIAAPDGNLTADLLTNGVTGTCLADQTITVTADVNCSFYRFIKAGTVSWIRMQIVNGGNSNSQWFNVTTGLLGTGVVAGTGVLASAKITAYPGGWYLCSMVGTVGSGLTSVVFRTNGVVADSSGVSVNGGTHYEWGAQFENNVPFPSSYIPTTGVAVTRNADVLTYPFAGNADATVGSVYAELSTFSSAASGNANAISLDTLGNNALYLFDTQAVTAISLSDGVNLALKGGISSMATGVRKRAGSWGPLGLRVTGDGLAVATNSFDGGMNSGASIGIGATTNGNGSWFGPIKNVRLWQTQIPDGALAALTA